VELTLAKKPTNFHPLLRAPFFPYIMLILRQNSKKIICLQVNLLTFFAKIFFAGIYFDKPELTLALDLF